MVDPTAVLVAVITGVTSVVGTWVANRRSNRQLKGDLAAVKHQVKNDHQTDLRADIDEVHRLVTETRGDVLDTKDAVHEQRALLETVRSDLRAHEGDANQHRATIYQRLAQLAIGRES